MDMHHAEVQKLCSLLGVFSRVPLAAVAPLPLGVRVGSNWYWWSESSRANRRFAYDGRQNTVNIGHVRNVGL